MHQAVRVAAQQHEVRDPLWVACRIGDCRTSAARDA